MSTDWKRKTRELLDVRQQSGSLVMEDQEDAYSESELKESLQELEECVTKAEFDLQQSLKELELLKVEAAFFPSEYSEEELQKIKEDSERLEKLQLVNEGTDESTKIIEHIRTLVEFVTSESQVPQVAQALEDEKGLIRRIRMLQQSSLAHENEIKKLQQTTEELVKALDEIQLDNLHEDTQALEELVKENDGTFESLPEATGTIDKDLAARLKKLRAGTQQGSVEIERLKTSINELEEIALTSDPMTSQELELKETLSTLKEGCEIKKLALNELKQSIEELELLAQTSNTDEQPILEKQLEELESLKTSTQLLDERLEKVEKFQQGIEGLQQQVQEQGLSSLQELGTSAQGVVAQLLPSEQEKAALLDYRKVWAQFRPNLVFAERLSIYEKANAESLEGQELIGQKILDGYAESEDLKKSLKYTEAKEKLLELIELVKTQRQQILERIESIARETEGKVVERQEAFASLTNAEGGEFDTDTDAKNFFLGNSIGSSGAIETSPKLRKMQQMFAEAIQKANELRKLGATPEEIGRVAMKGIPEAIWPDWMIKEVEAFKRAHEEIQAELMQRLVTKESEKQVEKFLTTQSKLIDLGDRVNEFVELLDIGNEQLREQAKDIFEEMGSQFELLEQAWDLGNNLGELFSTGEDVVDNPVKAKMIEFQKNRLIIDTTNKLVDLGLDIAGEVIPMVGVITNGKDAVMEICKAIEYFDMLHGLKKTKSGAKLDPRSAAYLPFCEIAVEKKIQAAGSVIKALSSSLKTIGKGLESGGVSALAGLIVEKVGDALKVGGKIVIKGIKWNKARKAHKYLKAAIGPPPIRKAIFKVQKHNKLYARHILVQCALDNDPWALEHLANIGLEKADLDNPNTTAEIVRQYMTMVSGGKLGEQIGEDQERIQDSAIGKFAMAVKGGGEKVVDVLIGRNTSNEYNANWKPARRDISRRDWQQLKEEAIQAGWYDTRSKLGNLIDEYEQIKLAYNPQDLGSVTTYYAMLQRLREGIADVRSSAKANDKKTPHKGMQTACDIWMDLIDVHLTNVSKDRSRIADEKYKGLNETDKKKLIETELSNAKNQQENKRNENYAKRVNLVQTALGKVKISTSVGTFNPSDTNSFLKSLETKFKLDQDALTEMRSFLINFKSIGVERVTNEVEASTDNKFESDMKRSLSQFVLDAGDMIRAKVEEVFEASERRANRNAPSWRPKPSHIAFDYDQLKGMLGEAETNSDWNKKGSEDIKKAMKELVKAREKFKALKTKFKDQDPSSGKVKKSSVDGLLGKYLGCVDAFESALRKFIPLTTKGLTHPGLVSYRQEMLEETLELRLDLGIDAEDWK